MNEELCEWGTLHKRLQDVMKQELMMLREVLSAMKEEEYVLMQRLVISKKMLGSKRCSLNKQLKILQKERSCLTKALVKTLDTDLYIHHFNSKNFNLLISQDEDNAVETFHLRDQILHLMKNIKQQKDRIAKLIRNGDADPCITMEILPTARHEDLSKKIQTINAEDSSSE